MSLIKRFHMRNYIDKRDGGNSLLDYLWGNKIGVLTFIIVSFILQTHTVYSQQVEQLSSAAKDMSLTSSDALTSNIAVQ